MFLRLMKFNCLKWEDSDFRKSLSVLQESERTKASRFFKVIDAKRSTSCHLILKSQLSRMHENLFVEDIELERSKENKPLWKHYDHVKYPGLNFNMSHSGSYSIVGICTHCVIGVDVQEIKLPGRIQKVQQLLQQLKSCFTWREWCVICLQETYHRVSEHEINEYLFERATEEELEQIKERLFCHWVLKESYQKAIGTGVFTEFERIEFTFSSSIFFPSSSSSSSLSSMNNNGNDSPTTTTKKKRKRDFTFRHPVKSTESLLTQQIRCRVDGELLKGWTFRLVQLDSSHFAAVAFGPIDNDRITESFKTCLKWDQENLTVLDLEKQSDVILKSLKQVYFEEIKEPVFGKTRKEQQQEKEKEGMKKKTCCLEPNIDEMTPQNHQKIIV